MQTPEKSSRQRASEPSQPKWQNHAQHHYTFRRWQRPPTPSFKRQGIMGQSPNPTVSIDQQKVVPGVWGARQNLSIWANFQHGYRNLLHHNHHKQGDQTRASIHHTRVGHKAVRMRNPQQMTLMLRVNNLHLGHNKDHLASVHRRHVHDKIHGKQRATQRSTFGMARPRQLVGVEPTAVPNHQPGIQIWSASPLAQQWQSWAELCCRMPGRSGQLTSWGWD